MLEEEGTIPRSKIITVGTMLLLLSVFFANDAFAGHRSHSSHGSHGSHSSHRSGSYHRSHVSHTSHKSHSNHGSHSNHKNHASHSNHSNATPVPIPNNVSLPKAPEMNMADTVSQVNGFSLNPAATPDPNVVLVRYSGTGTEPAANVSSSGLTAASAASGESIIPLKAGTMPQTMGTIPVTSGVVVPELTSLNVLQPEPNTFPAEVNDVKVVPAQKVPSSNDIKVGVQPKGSGKPVK